MFHGTIAERASQAECLLVQVAPGAACVPQEWDNRVDCVLKLADGTVVGEMVPLSDLTDSRIRETGERLRQRAEGDDVPLLNELHSPTRIVPLRDR